MVKYFRKMKKTITLAAIFITLNLLAQEKDTTYWTTEFKTGLTYNQASFSENWKSGGNNSVALNAFFNGKTSFQKDKIDWVTTADIQYGTVNNEGQGARKSNDKILIDSKFGYNINKKWNAYSSLNFLTQFDDGFDYTDPDNKLKISGSFAPAFITSSWGMEFKPNKEFYARISPFSPRITIVNDTTLYLNVPENYGVEVGETVRYEWKAFKLAANYEKNLTETVSLKTNYELFANLEGLKGENIDHRLDIFITAKVYKFLNLTLTNNYIYDIDQDKKLQSSLLIGLSILFDYNNK